MLRRLTAVLAAAGLTACSTDAPPPVVEQGPTRADTVAMAMAAFDPAAFDTITWDAPDDAVNRGSLVFRISCSKCHGEQGAGDGGFVMQGDTLRPPSFLAAGWRFAEDPMGLRQQIYTGNVAGMPYWGLVGLKYRDIDAVARYIQRFLRIQYGA